MKEPKHCDDYIEDPASPEPLRKFLERARSPAHGHLSKDPFPVLFATYQGERYRVVMASRMGDVGLSKNFDQPNGYALRVAVEDLTNFTDQP